MGRIRGWVVPGLQGKVLGGQWEPQRLPSIRLRIDTARPSLSECDFQQHLGKGLRQRCLTLRQLQHFAQLHHRYGQEHLAEDPASLSSHLLPGLPAPPAAFFQGYPLSLSTLSRKAHLIIPYPETDSWYLSLQLVCLQSPE